MVEPVLPQNESGAPQSAENAYHDTGSLKGAPAVFSGIILTRVDHND